MKKLTIVVGTAILALGIVMSVQADSPSGNMRTKEVKSAGSGLGRSAKSSSDRPSAPSPVPEPATMALLGGGLVGLYALKKKFNKE